MSAYLLVQDESRAEDLRVALSPWLWRGRVVFNVPDGEPEQHDHNGVVGSDRAS
jgi:hypothetical protein